MSLWYFTQSSHRLFFPFFLAGRDLVHHLLNLPHFKDGETEAQRRAVISLWSHSSKAGPSPVKEPDLCLHPPALPLLPETA